MNKKRISTKPKKEKLRYKFSSKNDMEAARKAKIAKAPLYPNKEPFDQGTSI